MINKLVLTNFQKHEDILVDFTSGLNVIRGLNENGKSSLMRGIAYAFFGSRALPMSLEETVTWGKPVASLKVELTFTHTGKRFKITRKKSGAELVGDGVTASGQAEVTAFVENLFGASASVAQATLLANQSSLQNGLDSSAMPLIEKLANMSLIDDLIGKVQTRLPSGSTKGVEAQLATVSATEKPVLETSELESRIDDLTVKVFETKSVLNVAEISLVDTQALAISGQQKQTANNTATALQNSLSSQLESLRPKLVVPDFQPQDTAKLDQLVKQSDQALALRSAWAKFENLAIGNVMSVADYEVQTKAASEQVSDTTQQSADLRVKIATLKSSKITESACGLCGKDLSEIPEVVSKNSEIDSSIRSLSEQLEAETEALGASKSKLSELATYQARASKLRAHFPIKFIELDETFIPPIPRWVGGEVPAAGDQPDYKLQLANALNDITNHARAVQAAELAQKQVADIQSRLDTIKLTPLSDEEVKALLVFDAEKQSVNAASKAYESAKQELQSVEASLTTAKAVHEANLKAWESGQEQRAKLVQLLSDYHFNNGIISKLREARPAVAAKLWALVLAGVSHYFSQIRGVASTVTRGERGFLVDGKSADAFSGSTRDSLGLAIRLMLQKTFLPNVSFMLADEPGAAFDDVRESDMLAVLAGSGLDQVILVTHSDLADTFAANVITI